MAWYFVKRKDFIHIQSVLYTALSPIKLLQEHTGERTSRLHDLNFYQNCISSWRENVFINKCQIISVGFWRWCVGIERIVLLDFIHRLWSVQWLGHLLPPVSDLLQGFMLCVHPGKWLCGYWLTLVWILDVCIVIFWYIYFIPQFFETPDDG
jgi:hypothetical protein